MDGQTRRKNVAQTACIETTRIAVERHEVDVALTPIVLRARAEAILDSLARAKAECERQMNTLRRVDLVKAVTGTSAIERAIDETRRTLDVLESEGV